LRAEAEILDCAERRTKSDREWVEWILADAGLRPETVDEFTPQRTPCADGEWRESDSPLAMIFRVSEFVTPLRPENAPQVRPGEKMRKKIQIELAAISAGETARKHRRRVCASDIFEYLGVSRATYIRRYDRSLRRKAIALARDIAAGKIQSACQARFELPQFISPNSDESEELDSCNVREDTRGLAKRLMADIHI
jgi:hypothetical protein